MCCPLCEEPVRSVVAGLAAVGVIAIVRTVQKTLAGARDSARNESETAVAEACAPASDNRP